MEEDKNLEQNLDKSDEKLHISDVITSCGRDRTKNSCVKCGEEFETWIKIDTGDYD
jgi:NAD-dependent SIR2 family protein deacetylase